MEFAPLPPKNANTGAGTQPAPLPSGRKPLPPIILSGSNTPASEVKNKKSFGDKVGGIFPHAETLIEEVKADPLNLNKNIADAPKHAWGALKDAWSNFVDAGNNFDVFKAPWTAEGVAQGLKAATGGVGLAFAPVSAVFEGGKDVPAVGTLVKAIEFPFAVATETVDATLVKGVDYLIDSTDLPAHTKENLKSASKDMFDLATQIALAEIGGPKIQAKYKVLKEKYGPIDAETIKNKAFDMVKNKLERTSSETPPTDASVPSMGKPETGKIPTDVKNDIDPATGKVKKTEHAPKPEGFSIEEKNILKKQGFTEELINKLEQRKIEAAAKPKEETPAVEKLDEEVSPEMKSKIPDETIKTDDTGGKRKEEFKQTKEEDISDEDPRFKKGTDKAKIAKFEDFKKTVSTDELVDIAVGKKPSPYPQELPATAVFKLVKEDPTLTVKQIKRLQNTNVASQAGADLQAVQIQRKAFINNAFDMISLTEQKLKEKINEKNYTEKTVKRFLKDITC